MRKIFWYEFQRQHFWALIAAAFKVLVRGKHTIWMGYEDSKRDMPKDVESTMTAWTREKA